MDTYECNICGRELPEEEDRRSGASEALFICTDMRECYRAYATARGAEPTEEELDAAAALSQLFGFG